MSISSLQQNPVTPTFASKTDSANEDAQSSSAPDPKPTNSPGGKIDPVSGSATTIFDLSDKDQQRLDKVKAYQEVVSRLIAELEGRDNSDGDEEFAANAKKLFGTDNERNYIQADSGNTIVADDSDDVIVVNSDNAIYAGDGENEVHANSGNTIITGNGDDVIIANSGNLIHAGNGNNRIYAGSNNTIITGAGDDQVRAGANNFIQTGGGSDTIFASSGNIINAGDGGDFISTSLADIGSWINGGDGNDRINATANSIIAGGAGDDIISVIGRGSSINFNKGDGNDIISSGSDIAINIGEGISKDDVRISHRAGQTILSFSGSEDSLTLDLRVNASAHLSFANGDSLEVKSARQPAAQEGPSDIASSIVFANSNNTIYAATGSNTIYANSGNTITAGDEGNKINANSGNTIVSGDGDNVITANSGNSIRAGSGNNVINAGSNNLVSTGQGDDIITVGFGNTITSGAGDDRISAAGSSIITGGTGDDIINVVGRGSSINFNKGDGRDTINSLADIAINIGTGISKDDLEISHEDGKTILSFQGTEDSLVLNLGIDATANISFADDGSLNIKRNGAETSSAQTPYGSTTVSNEDLEATSKTSINTLA